jgi:hypothetical protein
MAELTDPIPVPTVSSCCGPDAPQTCCEESEKAACCDTGST